MANKSNGKVHSPGSKELVYTEEISPALDAIMAKCKEHDICAIAAFAVPLTQNTGVTMLTISPNAAGTVPDNFKIAYDTLRS